MHRREILEDWKRWFAERRRLLAGMDVLVPHAVVQLDVSTVRRLASADDLMRVTGDRAAFEGAVRAAVPEFGGLPAEERYAEAPLEVVRPASTAPWPTPPADQVPNRRSPKSPRPGRMYLRSFSSRSRAAV